MQYRFKHPTQQDFMNTVDEVAGQDLSWYWNQAVYGTQVLDYEVLRATSDPVTGVTQTLTRRKARPTTRRKSFCIAKAISCFRFEADVKFDNGESTCEHWDGKARWVRYVYRKKAQVASVQIDPTIRSRMDSDYLNNSHVTESQRGATARWQPTGCFLTQFLAQMLSWLV